MASPYIPSYSSPSDTKNFESYFEEDATIACTDIDQTNFIDF